MGFRVHGSTWGAHITPPHLTGVLPFQKTMILIVFPNPQQTQILQKRGLLYFPTHNNPKFTKNGVPTAPYLY